MKLEKTLQKQIRQNKERGGLMSEIYLAGGCFWGTEKYFASIKGVISTEVYIMATQKAQLMKGL